MANNDETPEQELKAGKISKGKFIEKKFARKKKANGKESAPKKEMGNVQEKEQLKQLSMGPASTKGMMAKYKGIRSVKKGGMYA